MGQATGNAPSPAGADGRSGGDRVGSTFEAIPTLDVAAFGAADLLDGQDTVRDHLIQQGLSFFRGASDMAVLDDARGDVVALLPGLALFDQLDDTIFELPAGFLPATGQHGQLLGSKPLSNGDARLSAFEAQIVFVCAGTPKGRHGERGSVAWLARSSA